MRADDRKRIIINTREPKENEFVIHGQQTIDGGFIEEILNYVRDNSDLDYEWMRDVKFIESYMSGIRIIKKVDKDV